MVSLLVHPRPARARPHMWCPGIPTPVETEESDLRARPAFGLGVDSPGATWICSLLVRGIMTSDSQNNSSMSVFNGPDSENQRTCRAYNGQLVHPCRVKSFREAVS